MVALRIVLAVRRPIEFAASPDIRLVYVLWWDRQFCCYCRWLLVLGYLRIGVLSGMLVCFQFYFSTTLVFSSLLSAPVVAALTPLPSDSGPNGSSAYKFSIPFTPYEWFIGSSATARIMLLMVRIGIL